MSPHDCILNGLAAAPDILNAFVDAISDDQRHRRRRSNFWTIAEHVDHLAHVQPMLLSRVDSFGREERPRFVPYQPDSDADHWPPECIDVPDACRRFETQRRLLLDRVAALDPTVWDRRADHPEYEKYSFEILMRHILMHDHWHMYRIEELWLTREDFLEG